MVLCWIWIWKFGFGWLSRELAERATSELSEAEVCVPATNSRFNALQSSAIMMVGGRPGGSLCS